MIAYIRSNLTCSFTKYVMFMMPQAFIDVIHIVAQNSIVCIHYKDFQYSQAGGYVNSTHLLS